MIGHLSSHLLRGYRYPFASKPSSDTLTDGRFQVGRRLRHTTAEAAPEDAAVAAALGAALAVAKDGGGNG